MKRIGSKPQRGATLLVALVMLVLLTLMVSSAFTLSTTNLKSVNNMQMREEAMAAASVAIEQAISSAFTTNPTERTYNIDINNNNTSAADADYQVVVAAPECIGYTEADAAPPSSIGLGAMSDTTWDTLWDIRATVNDTATGTQLTMRQGILVRLPDIQKTNLCS